MRAVVIGCLRGLRRAGVGAAAHTRTRLLTTNASGGARKGLSSLRDDEVQGKAVFVRVDFNVPMKKGAISDDTRVRESLPTIEALVTKGARVILASHLGRPNGVTEELRLKPVADRLRALLRAKPAFASVQVTATTEAVGPTVVAAAKALKPRDILLLENVRFSKSEEKNDSAFAKALAADTGAEVYVNDAFGTAHRAHATTAGIRPFIAGPAVAGLLMQRELQALYGIRDAPAQPFVTVLGGAKVGDKIHVIEALLNKTKALCIGGGMAFPFLKAQGIAIGNSKVDDESVSVAAKVLALAKTKGVPLVLPVDVVAARAIANDAERRTVSLATTGTGTGAEAGVPAGWMGLDIGPSTVSLFAQTLASAKSVFWNGPMGVSEMPNFAAGTIGVAKTIAQLTANGAFTVVGGGDTVAAVAAAGLNDRFSHVSTGGGASLELLEGAALPGVEALDRL